MARNKIASKGALVVDGRFEGASFSFADGTTLKVELNDLSDSTLARLTVHGLLQKVGDSYSGINNIKDAVIAAQATINSLIKGDWSTRGEAGGMLLDALIEYFDGQQTEEQVRAKFHNMDADTKKTLKAHPKIKGIMARMLAERAEAAAEAAEDAEDIVI